MLHHGPKIKKKFFSKKHILLPAASVDLADTAFFLPRPDAPIYPPASNGPTRNNSNLGTENEQQSNKTQTKTTTYHKMRTISVLSFCKTKIKNFLKNSENGSLRSKFLHNLSSFLLPLQNTTSFPQNSLFGKRSLWTSLYKKNTKKIRRKKIFCK